MNTRARFKNIVLDNWFYILVMTVLVVMGLLVYYSLTIVQAGFVLWLKQLGVVVIGFVMFFWVAGWDYRVTKSGGWWLYLLLILLLLIVLLFGNVEFGAKRWIDIGFLSFQPVEIGKALFVIFMAKYLSEKGEYLTVVDLLKTIGLTALVVGLVMLQPDLGSALVFVAIWAGMVWASAVPRKYIAGMVVSLGLLIPVMWQFLHDYQKKRIFVFLDPSLDPYGAGYNVLQSQIAVGSGGWWGLGLGQGLQSQLHYLPVAYSDFAFAVLAEEFGFAGSLLVLVLFGYLLWTIWRIAFLAGDQFGYFLAIGVGSMLIFQVFINVAMNLGVMPVTGIPLPFISSGGTSLLVTMFLLALVYSIGKKSKYS
ncbi:rod shape-determining protein RodA [Patescibacteria group bacterium]|nr:rod shape-determining protein RodA [Patescibacteria group bacterium]